MLPISTEPFSGSYAPEDVRFLLQPLSIEVTSNAEKEQLIQSGKRHYSEMIGAEHAPSPVHQALFEQALAQGAARMGSDVAALANALALLSRPSYTLVSFVRAGAPLGVLLRRALTERGIEACHYGISIIRDRGIDRQALEEIIARHGSESIIFVDGWTGKGAISRELQRSLADDPRFPQPLPLVTLTDPCGHAWLAAGGDDWLIPSGIMGATVSGLISRTILTTEGYHGCMLWHHLQAHDVSRLFIDTIDRERQRLAGTAPAVWTEAMRTHHQQWAGAVIDRIRAEYRIDNLNLIKPGIAEATRAVLRRMPERILVSRPEDPDVQLLIHLGQQNGVRIETATGDLGPYRAITLIKKVHESS